MKRNKQKEKHVWDEMPVYLPDQSFQATNLTVRCHFVQYKGRSQIWSKVTAQQLGKNQAQKTKTYPKTRGKVAAGEQHCTTWRQFSLIP